MSSSICIPWMIRDLLSFSSSFVCCTRYRGMLFTLLFFAQTIACFFLIEAWITAQDAAWISSFLEGVHKQRCPLSTLAVVWCLVESLMILRLWKFSIVSSCRTHAYCNEMLSEIMVPGIVAVDDPTEDNDFYL
ncbi:uncharacterized protein [Narcine bancroftii]|uniref:uncharacterized protein isoform X4 n=1 Tax=Narcine bancroftii TaxID=1343680 RepID=UPI0038310AB0